MAQFQPLTAAKVDPRRLYEINAEAARFYQHQLHQQRPDSAAAYLRDHGIDHAAAPDSPWQIGYAVGDWTALVNHLRQRGHDDDTIHAAGLASHGRHGQPLDRFRDRLVFPVHTPDGHVAGFTARDLTNNPDQPKWTNTPETRVYRKGELLYGLGPQRGQITGQDTRTLAVAVEGPADAIAVQRMATETAGPGRAPVVAVAPCGTALTEAQLDQLQRHLPAADLAVAFDGDSAGRAAYSRAYPLLRTWPGRRYGIELPEGTDPAELIADRGPEQARAELAQRTQPAARMALTARLDQLITAGHISHPKEWVEDRVLAYRAIADYFLDDPHDTAQLARAAAERLDLHDGEVLRGVIERTFPDVAEAQFQPPQPAQVAAKVQRAREAVATRAAGHRSIDPADLAETAARHTTRTTEGGPLCLTTT